MLTALTIIRKFVHIIDKTIEVDFDADFYADIKKHKIYVENCEHVIEDKLIQNFVLQEFKIKLDPFLIGILHEVGHIKTYNKKLDNERQVMYALLSINNNENNFEEYSNLYFRIPAEYKATEWAVNYYKQNKELCDSFLNELYSDD